ncbi:MAG: hypothetical protein WA765_09980 [Candidatus Acidiferrum sp.]
MSANRAGGAAILTAIALVLAGCNHAVRSYQLSRHGGVAILIPPGVTPPGSVTLEVKLSHARRAPFRPTGCDVDRSPLTVQWHGSTAYIRAESESELLGFGQGSIKGQPVALDPRGKVKGESLALDPLKYINEFRADLSDLEENGCLHAGESQILETKIGQSLPLAPFLAYLLRFGVFDLNEFVDLTSDFRLRIVYPEYSASNQMETKEITGVKTIYYKIVSVPKDGRVRILRAKSGDTSSDRQNEIASPFPESSAYFRLFLRKSPAAKDVVTVAIVLSSADRKHLDDATKELDASAEASCRAVAGSDADCIMFPPLTGVNAEIRVKANGKDAFARLGARVDELIDEVKDNDDPPRSVQVKRLFDKRLVPVKAASDEKDILALILMPGDVVSYR